MNQCHGALDITGQGFFQRRGIDRFDSGQQIFINTGNQGDGTAGYAGDDIGAAHAQAFE